MQYQTTVPFEAIQYTEDNRDEIYDIVDEAGMRITGYTFDALYIVTDDWGGKLYIGDWLIGHPICGLQMMTNDYFMDMFKEISDDVA